MALQVIVDWERDSAYGAGVYGASAYGGMDPEIDDVTSLVRPGFGAVSIEYGRDQSTALAPTIAGRGSLVLDNRDKRFSPRNTTSPLYGLLKPARPVWITRTITGGAVFTLFAAHTDDNPINPDVNSKTVTLSLVDSLADFRGQKITTALYSGIRTGEAISHILDACGWPSGLRDLDGGATIIPWWWEDGTDALDALEKVLRSEGPPAMLTLGSGGEIVFRDRHHRLMNERSLTSQQSWTDDTTGDVRLNVPFTYDEAWRNIINIGVVDVDVRQPQDLQAVWQSDTTITLNGGEQKTITVSTSDPFLDAIPPVAGVDYTVTSGSVTIQLGRTSGASTPIVLTAGGGGAIITALQVRGHPVSTTYTLQVSASDTGSITDYGARSFPGDLPWCNPYDAEAVLTTVVAQRAQPLPILETRFLIGHDVDRAEALLLRDISDRVSVAETETVLDHEFFIENIRHEFTGEHDHAVMFGLEMAPIPLSPIARTDTQGAGADQGYLAGGFDDPSTMAICDSDDFQRWTDAGAAAT